MDINKKNQIQKVVDKRMRGFANRLRTLRESTPVDGKLLTQTELGGILGVSRMTIYSYETTASNIKLSTVIKIAEVYNVPITDLIS